MVKLGQVVQDLHERVLQALQALDAREVDLIGRRRRPVRTEG